MFCQPLLFAQSAPLTRRLAGVLLSVLAAVNMAAAASLPPEVRALMKKHKVTPERVGVVIHRIGEAAPLVSHQPAKRFNPASVMKLPLSFAAFDLLGPRHTWKTVVAHAGVIKNGVLDGDLYLLGGGDPYLTADRFLLLMNDLRSRGLRVINGDLIIDDTHFMLPPHDPKAFDGAPHKPYNAGGSALAINFQAHRIVIVPQPGAIHVYSEPPNDNLVIDNQLRVGKTRCRNWRGRISERYRGGDNRMTLTLKGRYAQRCGEQDFRVSLLNPGAYAAGVFGALWRRLGGEWNGTWRRGTKPPTAVVTAVYESPPLTRIVVAMNKFSNNVMARNIFVSLAKKNGKPPYSPAAARAVFDRWLREQGVQGEFFIDNGSGLSRQSKMSAGQLGLVLQNLWAHPLRAEVLASLPILGADGTLRKRLSKNGAALQGHLKTGSLDGVKAIAGFIRDRKQRDIVFVCFTEKQYSGRAKRFQDALIRWARAQP